MKDFSKKQLSYIYIILLAFLRSVYQAKNDISMHVHINKQYVRNMKSCSISLHKSMYEKLNFKQMHDRYRIYFKYHSYTYNTCTHSKPADYILYAWYPTTGVTEIKICYSYNYEFGLIWYWKTRFFKKLRKVKVQKECFWKFFDSYAPVHTYGFIAFTYLYIDEKWPD